MLTPIISLDKSLAIKLVPLSEDQRLILDDPLHVVMQPGELKNWDEVTVLSRGERRLISLDVRVGKGAQGRMMRVFHVPEGARLIVLHHVTVAEQGSWQSGIYVRGKGEVRVRRVLELHGRAAKTKLDCVGILEASGRISVADEIFTLAPETKAQLRTKIVLKDSAYSEARGRIVVNAAAKQSESYERLDHLLLGPQARAVGIPELEVYTDDAKCGHGATTSQPSDQARFHLASRGLTPAAADGLLANGFVLSALDELTESVRRSATEILLA